MTDLAGPLESPLARADTDAAADSRQARVEALQRRRAAGTTMVRTEPMPIPLSARPVDADRPVRTSRAGAARGSKIAAAGFGVTAMLGLVAAMGFASATSASAPPAPLETVPPVQVVVVVHPAAGTADSTAVADSPGAVAATPTPPIALSAQPTVRQAPASQAPAAKTNGSR